MESRGTDEVVHENPVWRDRANFIIAAPIPREGIDTNLRWEQLWARQLGADRFEICCIPFFLNDIALGDEVRTGLEGTDRYVIKEVTKPSGRYVFRVWIQDPGLRGQVIVVLAKLGA